METVSVKWNNVDAQNSADDELWKRESNRERESEGMHLSKCNLSEVNSVGLFFLSLALTGFY